MIKLRSLVSRNIKLFFKDKGMFFTSLVTPLILLVLYCTFLGKVYKDSFSAFLSMGIAVEDKILDATVGGQLISSLLAVCCVTVSFCANFLMVQDKVSGVRKDLVITSVKSTVLALGYYLATLAVSLIICYIALIAGLIYLSACGWYLAASDVVLLIIDVFLLVMFGTALSSIINFFLTSQGQISAVGTIISAGYGFICGAYMPISQFGEGLQKVLSFFPGTYATSLLRNHAMQGTFSAMKKSGVSEIAVNEMKSMVDCNIEFMGNAVNEGMMFLVLGASVVVLITIYICLNIFIKKKN